MNIKKYNKIWYGINYYFWLKLAILQQQKLANSASFHLADWYFSFDWKFTREIHVEAESRTRRCRGFWSTYERRGRKINVNFLLSVGYVAVK